MISGGVDRLRFTPARAGTIPSTRTVPVAATVHPRACGDNVDWGRTNDSTVGSPPRVRGQLARFRQRWRCPRFTPARAGTITSSWLDPVPDTVHPRACGDNESRSRGCRRCAGSPPRVRGQFAAMVWRSRTLRFTPARAGTIDWLPFPPCRPSVHPRACGDNQYRAASSDSAPGSPPRVRGQ